MRRGPLTAVVTTLALLAAPAFAAAKTITVDPGSSGSPCAGTTCRTIAGAVGIAVSNDTIDVRAGTYAETVTVGAAIQNLTITGAGADATKLVGTGSNFDALTLQGNGARVSNLGIDLAANARRAIFVDGAQGVSLDGLRLVRSAASDQNFGVLETNAGGAQPTRLSGAVVFQGTGPATAPGVKSTGAGGLAVSDATIFSTAGPGASFTGSEGNRLDRVSSVATRAGADGVEVVSSTAGAKKLVVESSELAGTGEGAGLRVTTSTTAPGVPATGNVAVQANHVTIAGSARSVVLDGTAARGTSLPPPAGSNGPVGNIAATITNSLVLGARDVTPFTGSVGQLANTATLDVRDSITDGNPGQFFEDAGGRNYRLRADSPAIDRGGPEPDGASDKDRTGGPRKVQGNLFLNREAADYGAYEFTNRPPTVRLSIPEPAAKEGQGVRMEATGFDPDQAIGGSVIAYAFDFGDGTPQQVGPANTAFHAYARRGTFNVGTAVLDSNGGIAASNIVPVTVSDGFGPTLAIGSPKANGTVKLTRTTTRGRGKRKVTRRVAIPITGAVGDDAGVASVQLVVRGVSTTKKVRKRNRTTRIPQTGTCQDVSTGGKLFREPCGGPRLLSARITDRRWSYSITAKNKLLPGTYDIYAIATDLAGNVTQVAPRRFKLK